MKLDSMCGLLCETCGYKTSAGCGGCIETGGKPFHGKCDVADCCSGKNLSYCGKCPEFPCETLTLYSSDPEHGDKPAGARIEQCRRWNKENI